uniref:Mut7-C RNAse domain-containing protein n=1 Tax=Brassica oleracea var. oleracea TaxID=109376 RepID=A0A0D3AXV5_BRAOL
MGSKKKQKQSQQSPLPSQYQFFPRTTAPPVPNRRSPPGVSDYPPPRQLFQDSHAQTEAASAHLPQPSPPPPPEPRRTETSAARNGPSSSEAQDSASTERPEAVNPTLSDGFLRQINELISQPNRGRDIPILSPNFEPGTTCTLTYPHHFLIPRTAPQLLEIAQFLGQGGSKASRLQTERHRERHQPREDLRRSTDASHRPIQDHASPRQTGAHDLHSLFTTDDFYSCIILTGEIDRRSEIVPATVRAHNRVNIIGSQTFTILIQTPLSTSSGRTTKDLHRPDQKKQKNKHKNLKTNLKIKPKKNQNPTRQGKGRLHPSGAQTGDAELSEPLPPGDFAGDAEQKKPPPPGTSNQKHGTQYHNAVQKFMDIVRKYWEKIMLNLKESDLLPRISKNKSRRLGASLKNVNTDKHLVEGIDAAVPPSEKPDSRELLDQALKENRVLLTRDTKLLRHQDLAKHQIYRVKSLLKNEQLLEVIETFQLKISENQLMSRCTKCNGKFIQKPLTIEEAIEAAKGFQRIPNCLFNKNLEFWQCMNCHQLYWESFMSLSLGLVSLVMSEQPKCAL